MNVGTVRHSALSASTITHAGSSSDFGRIFHCIGYVTPIVSADYRLFQLRSSEESPLDADERVEPIAPIRHPCICHVGLISVHLCAVLKTVPRIIVNSLTIHWILPRYPPRMSPCPMTHWYAHMINYDNLARSRPGMANSLATTIAEYVVPYCRIMTWRLRCSTGWLTRRCGLPLEH